MNLKEKMKITKFLLFVDDNIFYIVKPNEPT